MPLLNDESKAAAGAKGEAIKKGIEETVEKVKNIEVLKIANGLETFRGYESLKGYFDSSYGFVVFEKIAKVCASDWVGVRVMLLSIIHII